MEKAGAVEVALPREASAWIAGGTADLLSFAADVDAAYRRQVRGDQMPDLLNGIVIPIPTNPRNISVLNLMGLGVLPVQTEAPQ